MSAERKAKAIRLMGFDIDGVMTDGRLYYGPDGETLKVFHSRDGHGLKLLMRAGIVVVVISGRRSAALEARCAELGVHECHLGVEDKLATLQTILARRNLTRQQSGYMGDDIVDLEILCQCGFSAAPADAHPEVCARVDYRAALPGGHGAVREVCDWLLKTQNRYHQLVQEALGSAAP